MNKTDQNQKQLFIKAWCPLFGKLPSVSPSNELANRCIKSIIEARKNWGINVSQSSNLDSSWPETSEIHDYSQELIGASRYIYGAWSFLGDKYFNFDNEGSYELFFGIDNPFPDFNFKFEHNLSDEDYNYLTVSFPNTKIEEYQILSIQAIKHGWNALEDILVNGENEFNLETMQKLGASEQKLLMAEKLIKDNSIKEMSSHVERSKLVIEGGRKGGEKRWSGKGKEVFLTLHENWQREANNLWKKKPDLSKSNVAHYISKKMGGNSDTIRRIIKKPKE